MDGNLFCWMIEERFWKKRLPMARTKNDPIENVLGCSHESSESNYTINIYGGFQK